MKAQPIYRDNKVDMHKKTSTKVDTTIDRKTDNKINKVIFKTGNMFDKTVDNILTKF